MLIPLNTSSQQYRFNLTFPKHSSYFPGRWYFQFLKAERSESNTVPDNIIFGPNQKKKEKKDTDQQPTSLYF